MSENSYIERNKELWKEHFENIRLNYPNEEVIRFLAKCRSYYPEGRMLDWGCATGRHTKLACDMGFDVIACDYVDNCVKITKKKVDKECKYSRGKVVKYIVNKDLDVEEIERESLDIILVWGVLFYNTKENVKVMIENMYKMLNKGGRVFCDFRTPRDSICVDRNVSKKDLATDMFVLTNESAGKSGTMLSIFELDEIKEILEKAGFFVEADELNEFTQDNQRILNSWWHITLLKR